MARTPNLDENISLQSERFIEMLDSIDNHIDGSSLQGLLSQTSKLFNASKSNNIYNMSQVLENHRDCVTQAHPNDCGHIHNFWVEQPSFFMCGDIYRCRMTKKKIPIAFCRLLLIIWYIVNK